MLLAFPGPVAAKLDAVAALCDVARTVPVAARSGKKDGISGVYVVLLKTTYGSLYVHARKTWLCKIYLPKLQFEIVLKVCLIITQ